MSVSPVGFETVWDFTPSIVITVLGEYPLNIKDYRRAVKFIAITRSKNYKRIALTNFVYFILPSPCCWQFELVPMTEKVSVSSSTFPSCIIFGHFVPHKNNTGGDEKDRGL